MKIVSVLALFAGLLAAQNPNAINLTSSGSITAANANCTATSCVWIVMPLNTAAASASVSGTFSATVQFESSVDNVNWASIASTGSATSASAPGIFSFTPYGQQYFRVRASSYASGTIAVAITSASLGAGPPNASGIAGVPYCSGFAPASGQVLSFTTSSAPNPCWTASNGGGGGNPFTATTLYAPSSSGTTTVAFNSITAAKVVPTAGSLTITLALTAPTSSLSTPMLLGLCNPAGGTETWSLPGNAINIVTPSDAAECVWELISYDSTDSTFNGPGSTATPSIIKFSAQRTDPASVTPGGALNPNSATGNLDYTGPDLNVRAPVLKGADINPDNGQVTGLGHVTNGSLLPTAFPLLFSSAGTGSYWPFGMPTWNGTSATVTSFSNACTTTCNVTYYEVLVQATVTFNRYRFRTGTTAAASQYLATAVYNSAGNAIAASECTAGVSWGSTSTTVTCPTTSATTLTPGVYFMAIVGTSTSGSLIMQDGGQDTAQLMNADSVPRVFYGSNTASQSSGTFTWPSSIGTRTATTQDVPLLVLMP